MEEKDIKQEAMLAAEPRSERGWMVEHMKENGYVKAITYRDEHSVSYITVFITKDGVGEVYFHSGGESEYFYSEEEYPSWIEKEGWNVVEVLEVD